MVEFAVFAAAEPGRREKARYVFALGPVVHSIHIQTSTVNTIQVKSPNHRSRSLSSRQHLPARYATPSVAAYYNVHHRHSSFISRNRSCAYSVPTISASSLLYRTCTFFKASSSLVDLRRGKTFAERRTPIAADSDPCNARRRRRRCGRRPCPVPSENRTASLC
jgi:hypothetical protein